MFITRLRRQGVAPAAAVAAALLLSLTPIGDRDAQAQGQGNALAIGQAFAPVFPPLRSVRVPDVNEMGLLESSEWWGQAANQDPANPGVNRTYTITQAGNKQALVQLGYSLFWDMQVGSDGITACASCHFHMGADHRDTNQLSPGIIAGDNLHDVGSPNSQLTAGDYGHPDPGNTLVPVGTGFPSGLPHDEQAIFNVTHTPDGPNGEPGTIININDLVDGATDANDVVSSQGHRLTTFTEIVPGNRHDNGVPALQDSLANGCGDTVTPNTVAPFRLDLDDAIDDCGFNNNKPFTDTVSTVRRVEPRNTPSAHHAIFNARNFWDGRANIFFNMVNPSGMLDPDARVPRWDGSGIEWTRTDVPFSSAASQAVGPPLSFFEMSMDGRSWANLGAKISGAKPLAGQEILCDDAIIGSGVNIFGGGNNLLPACTDSTRGVTNIATYRDWITSIFHSTWWGTGNTAEDVCVDANGANPVVRDAGACLAGEYSLLEFNFAAFFGLAVQAYEAILFTDRTMTDVMGGDHTATHVLNSRRVPIEITNLPLEQCGLVVRRNGSGAEQMFADNACLEAFAIDMIGGIPIDANGDPLAAIPSQGVVTGPEGYTEPVPEFNELTRVIDMIPVRVNALTVIDEAVDTATVDPLAPNDCNPNDNNGADLIDDATCRMRLIKAVFLKVDRGIGRFQAGATGCMICHVGANLTGATVDNLTGFGAPPPEVVAPGLPVEAEAFMERMVSFSGRQVVYDAGFYNIGNRPTPEDIAIGGSAGDVPLAHTQLLRELLAADPDLDGTNIQQISALFDFGPNPAGQAQFANLRLPVSQPFDATDPFGNQYRQVFLDQSVPFTLTFLCAPGINLNANPVNPGRRGGGNRVVDNVCPPNLLPTDQFLRNGAFKTPGLRGVRGTGPYFHTGNKKDLREMLEFYKHAGDFPGLNLTNLDAGIRIFNLDDPANRIGGDETAVIEFLATGYTGWDAFYERGKFGHPELCVPNGHADTGHTVLVGIPATVGNDAGLQTFDELMNGRDEDTALRDLHHTMDGDCTVPGLASAVAAAGAAALVNPLVHPTVVVPTLGFEITGGSISVGVIDVGLTVARAAYRINPADATDPWTDVAAGAITGGVAGDGAAPNWFVAIPGIADGDSVEVTILDAAGNVATATGTAFVNDAPVITSGALFNAQENQTAIGPVTATDEEDDAAGILLTFEIVGGADQGAISISATGVLTFDEAPDFDVPGSANADNDYEITVRVTDSLGAFTEQNITVTVTNDESDDQV